MSAKQANITALDFGAASGEQIVRNQDPCGFPPACGTICSDPLPPRSDIPVHRRKSLLFCKLRSARASDSRAVVLSERQHLFGHECRVFDALALAVAASQTFTSEARVPSDAAAKT